MCCPAAEPANLALRSRGRLRSGGTAPGGPARTLLGEEVAGRDRSALATRRAAAAFPTGKTFDAWQTGASSIPVPTQQAVRTLEWVGRRENLVVCGPSGTGKTFMLEALGQQAVEQGLRVAWSTLENLGVLLRRHRADDSVTKAITRVLRADLVSPATPPRASTASSTPPTKNGPSPSGRTCTPPRSTS